jgi:hypothetical protein
LKLDERIVVGHVYGSIASVFPYALRPSQGTFPSNALLEITVTRSLSQSRSSTEGIPASVTTKRAGR